MDYKIIFPLEILLTVIQFIMLWTIFYLLYRPVSKTKRIALIVFMVLFRPLQRIVALFTAVTSPLKIMLAAALFIILILLSEGRRRSRVIAAICLWDIGILVEAVYTGLFLGITGTVFIENTGMRYLGMAVIQTVMLLWAVFYYHLMRAIPQEALDRVPLRFWLIVLFVPFFAAASFFAVIDSLLTQLEAGFNNFLFFGFFSMVIFALDLCILYLYIKLITSYHSRLLAEELARTPPVYTPENGLSAVFVEKYDLSKRQIEIIEALLRGKSNKEIAASLNIEVNTVQVHLQNVYRKTGAPGRYAIMALVGNSGNAV
jgi:DNA-binding CsgD family transcriptional regulator